MGGKGYKYGVNGISSTSLEAIVERVEDRVAPRVDRRVDAEISRLTESSGLLERQGEPVFITEKDLRIAMDDKCKECQSKSGPLGDVVAKLEQIAKQFDRWAGEQTANKRWKALVGVIATGAIVAMFAFGFARMFNKIDERQSSAAAERIMLMQKMDQIANQIAHKAAP